VIRQRRSLTHDGVGSHPWFQFPLGVRDIDLHTFTVRVLASMRINESDGASVGCFWIRPVVRVTGWSSEAL
jgi:hypothetical protein